MRTKTNSILFIFTVTLLFSCTKLEFTPENSVSADDAFKTKEDFRAVLNYAYDKFANQMSGNVQNMSELLADNIDPINLSTEYGVVYKRSTFKFRTGDCLDMYTSVYHCNKVIEQLQVIDVGFTDAEKAETEAEARFVRAWCHWELVKLYAQPYGFTQDNSHPGVPIRIDSDYKVVNRNSVKEVYDFVIAELNAIEPKLLDINPFYATKWSAKALLAKVHFQMHDYTNALLFADDVIKNSGFRLSDSVNRVDPASAVEHIFAISSTMGNNKSNSLTGNYRSDANPNPSFRAVKELALMSTGNDLDKRASLYKKNNVGKPSEAYVFTKYNKDVFNIPLLHLTDMILIRSECYAIKGENQKSYDDLMLIRKRAYGEGNRIFDMNISTLQDSINYERRIEMVTEGDRVQQLKRLGSEGKNIQIRNAPWNCPGMILQFPNTFTTEGFIFNEEGGCN